MSWATINHPKPKLHSGQAGNGGRAIGDGQPLAGPRGNRRKRNRDMPYRVIATSAGQWSTSVSHNSTRIYRDER